MNDWKVTYAFAKQTDYTCKPESAVKCPNLITTMMDSDCALQGPAGDLDRASSTIDSGCANGTLTVEKVEAPAPLAPK